MSHRAAELRSIELHRLVAERIRDDERVIDRARARVRDWLRDGTVDTTWARSWMDLLDGPRRDLLDMLVADTQQARDLRQVTPFAGVVPDAERWRIIREIGRADAS